MIAAFQLVRPLIFRVAEQHIELVLLNAVGLFCFDFVTEEVVG